MFVILIFVVGLVAWSLHLMQQAMNYREFSLMLAGFLVATAAAAMMTVYFLMGNYIGYVTQAAHNPYYLEESPLTYFWAVEPGELPYEYSIDVTAQESFQTEAIRTIAADF